MVLWTVFTPIGPRGPYVHPYTPLYSPVLPLCSPCSPLYTPVNINLVTPFIWTPLKQPFSVYNMYNHHTHTHPMYTVCTPYVGRAHYVDPLYGPLPIHPVCSPYWTPTLEMSTPTTHPCIFLLPSQETNSHETITTRKHDERKTPTQSPSKTKSFQSDPRLRDRTMVSSGLSLNFHLKIS